MRYLSPPTRRINVDWAKMDGWMRMLTLRNCKGGIKMHGSNSLWRARKFVRLKIVFLVRTLLGTTATRERLIISPVKIVRIQILKM